MARSRRAAREWERFGRENPYFGVLSEERYLRENVDEEALEAFFATGREHVAAVIAMAEEHVGAPLRLARALDFGCGVGRLLLALAERADEAIGVDVSPAMLAEVRRACAARRIDNVVLVQTDDLASLAPGLDLVMSFIVFQHIPSATGYELLGRLADLLAPGGVAVLQFTLTPASRLAYPFYGVLRTVPPARRLWNRVRRRAPDFPFMEMNVYRLERLLAILQARGIGAVSVRFAPAAHRADYNQATLVFARPQSAGSDGAATGE